MKKEKKTVMLAAGGTGGHVYPAVAVGERLRARFPDVEAWFAGRPAGRERDEAALRGFSYAPVNAA
ncbi:MAG: glycosyltransferase, partial [bacterium]